MFGCVSMERRWRGAPEERAQATQPTTAAVPKVQKSCRHQAGKIQKVTVTHFLVTAKLSHTEFHKRSIVPSTDRKLHKQAQWAKPQKPRRLGLSSTTLLRKADLLRRAQKRRRHGSAGFRLWIVMTRQFLLPPPSSPAAQQQLY